MAKVRVEGIPKLRAYFATVEKQLLEAAIPPMLDGAEKIAASARQLVPRDTGHLASTIRTTGKEKTRNHGNPMTRVLAGDDSTKVGSPNKIYQLARIKEFGARKSGQAAQPFLRPAARRHRPAIRAAIRRAIMQAVLKMEL